MTYDSDKKPLKDPTQVVVSHHAPHTPIRQQEKRQKHHDNWKSVFTTIFILLAAPLLAIVLTVYVFQTYQVDGPSMKETLHSGDRLIVWKVPRTWSKITGNNYIPNRGDIVVFNEPQIDDNAQGKQLIKRVVGLPNERITIEDNQITIFNDEHPEGFIPDIAPDALPSQTPMSEDILIPEGHIYVIGDNRGNSLDSRSFGPISSDNIVGKLIFRLLPIDQAQKF
jgi:signal peptidase I